ncbi:MAG: ATP-binding protein [Pseudomonadota bacterium]
MPNKQLQLSDWTDVQSDYISLLRDAETALSVEDVARRMIDAEMPIHEFDSLHESVLTDGEWTELQRQKARRMRAQVLATYDRTLSGLRVLEKKYRREVIDKRKSTETLSRKADTLAAIRDNYRSEVLIQQRVLVEKAGELERLNLKIGAQRDELQGFLYAVSHDLKAPANTVISLLTQFLEDHETAEIDRTDLEDAVGTANRIQTMLGDLLDFSMALDGAVSADAVDLNVLVADIIADLSGSRADQKIDVVQDTLPSVVGSEFQLRLLFQNLIANAVKFCPPDRVPHVEIRNKGPRGLSHVAIAVRDNGIGIEEAFHEKIFGLFNRLHSYSEYPGTGLGLALCQRVIRNHNGQLHLVSLPGEGSTFTVILPV